MSSIALDPTALLQPFMHPIPSLAHACNTAVMHATVAEATSNSPCMADAIVGSQLSSLLFTQQAGILCTLVFRHFVNPGLLACCMRDVVTVFSMQVWHLLLDQLSVQQLPLQLSVVSESELLTSSKWQTVNTAFLCN